MTTQTYSYLRWPGGKRKLVPKIKAIYENYRDLPLFEPFCGALNVALGLKPKKAILMDSNQPLINLHRHVQMGLSLSIPEPSEQNYYKIREQFNKCLKTNLKESAIAAKYFYYLNRLCYNGLCRFSSNGFNVPFGDIKKPLIHSSLWEYQPLMQNWCFINSDFEVEIPKTFIYADPPYDQGFTNYSGQEFTWDDQVRLAKFLARHDGPVVASNRASGRIVDLYRDLGFEIEIIDMPRSISCNGDRAPAQEMFATKGV